MGYARGSRYLEGGHNTYTTVRTSFRARRRREETGRHNGIVDGSRTRDVVVVPAAPSRDEPDGTDVFTNRTVRVVVVVVVVVGGCVTFYNGRCVTPRRIYVRVSCSRG